MNKLEEIFRKRLKRIREELNRYINSHYLKPMSSFMEQSEYEPQKKKGGVQECKW